MAKVTLLTPVGPITFARRNLQPPTQLYVTDDDIIQVEVLNAHPTTDIEVRLRLLTLGGELRYANRRFTPNRDRSRSLHSFQLIAGYIQSLVVVVTDTDVKRGQCWVTAGVTQVGVQGAGLTLGLFADYITSTNLIGWPGGFIRQSVEGAGAMRYITGTDPAAGFIVTEIVPTNARWRLVGIQVQIITSAAAGNRDVVFTLQNQSGVEFFEDIADTSMPPGSSRELVAGAGVTRHDVSKGLYMFSFPLDMRLLALGAVIFSLTPMDAGDNFGAPTYLVEEWIEE